MIKTAWIVTNYSCNNDCSYCYANLAGCENKIISFDYCRQVMKELARINVSDVLLIGGEPTLYSKINDVIAFGKSLGLKIKIVTNGRLLKDVSFLKELVKAGLDHVSISIESYNQEKHNEICGANSFQETLQGIINCVENDLSLNSISTVSKDNKEDIAEISELMSSVGVKNILFNYGVPSVFTNALIVTAIVLIVIVTVDLLKKQIRG
jgi:MoaA/NifB/PqqE/SkfB family radical SAM enzyme